MAALLQEIFWGAMAFTLILNLYQLLQNSKFKNKEFENTLNHRYRDLTREIPVRALLGEELSDNEFEENFEWLYYYLDFTNEQIYLRKQGKISSESWREWRAGIMSNMEQPAFCQAWQEVNNSVDDDFDELRTLLNSEQLADEDPREWADKSTLEHITHYLKQKVN
jgi:hypothetical protein